MAGIDFDLLLADWWDFSSGSNSLGLIIGGLPWGDNPAYTLSEFRTLYPQFFGVSTPVAGCTFTAASATFTAPAGVTFAVGQYIECDVASGTVTSVAGTSVTISTSATASGNYDVSQFANPPLPFSALYMFILLATAHLSANILGEAQWRFAMGLYVAHHAVLFLRSMSSPDADAGQIVAAAIEQGVTVGASVGGASYSKQLPIQDADFSNFQQTSFGAQLVQLVRLANCGPVFVR